MAASVLTHVSISTKQGSSDANTSMCSHHCISSHCILRSESIDSHHTRGFMLQANYYSTEVTTWNWVLNAVSMVLKALLDSASLSYSGFGLPECFYPRIRSMKPLSLVSKEVRIKKTQKYWLEFETTFFHSFLKAAQAESCSSSSWLRHKLKTPVLCFYTLAVKDKIWACFIAISVSHIATLKSC